MNVYLLIFSNVFEAASVTGVKARNSVSHVVESSVGLVECVQCSTTTLVFVQSAVVLI